MAGGLPFQVEGEEEWPLNETASLGSLSRPPLLSHRLLVAGTTVTLLGWARYP